MKITLRKVIGATLIASVYVALFLYAVAVAGIAQALIALGSTVAFFAAITGGVLLLISE